MSLYYVLVSTEVQMVLYTGKKGSLHDVNVEPVHFMTTFIYGM